jgi:hypothetical protein
VIDTCACASAGTSATAEVASIAMIRFIIGTQITARRLDGNASNFRCVNISHLAISDPTPA